MADISIKDAPLINNVSGAEKIPVSNGSNKPAAITVNLILDKVPEPDLTGYVTEELLALKGYITGEALNQFQETIMNGPILAINNNLSNNYYTKSEIDNMIISTLNTEV